MIIVLRGLTAISCVKSRMVAQFSKVREARCPDKKWRQQLSKSDHQGRGKSHGTAVRHRTWQSTTTWCHATNNENAIVPRASLALVAKRRSQRVAWVRQPLVSLHSSRDLESRRIPPRPSSWVWYSSLTLVEQHYNALRGLTTLRQTLHRVLRCISGSGVIISVDSSTAEPMCKHE